MFAGDVEGDRPSDRRSVVVLGVRRACRCRRRARMRGAGPRRPHARRGCAPPGEGTQTSRGRSCLRGRPRACHPSGPVRGSPRRSSASGPAPSFGLLAPVPARGRARPSLSPPGSDRTAAARGRVVVRAQRVLGQTVRQGELEGPFAKCHRLLGPPPSAAAPGPSC